MHQVSVEEITLNICNVCNVLYVMYCNVTSWMYSWEIQNLASKVECLNVEMKSVCKVIKNVSIKIYIVIQENIFKRKWVKFALCILYLRIFIRKTCWIYLWQFMLKELKSERKQEKTNLKKYTSTPLVALHPSLTIKFL